LSGAGHLQERVLYTYTHAHPKKFVPENNFLTAAFCPMIYERLAHTHPLSAQKKIPAHKKYHLFCKKYFSASATLSELLAHYLIFLFIFLFLSWL
jgi:hypothetical protein